MGAVVERLGHHAVRDWRDSARDRTRRVVSGVHAVRSVNCQDAGRPLPELCGRPSVCLRGSTPMAVLNASLRTELWKLLVALQPPVTLHGRPCLPEQCALGLPPGTLSSSQPRPEQRIRDRQVAAKDGLSLFLFCQLPEHRELRQVLAYGPCRRPPEHNALSANNLFARYAGLCAENSAAFDPDVVG